MASPTVGNVIELIQKALPPVDPDRTADVLHAGDPAAVATGVVVTFQATRGVLEQAIRLGANLIVTHEPTYYVDGPTTILHGDPVFEGKRRFIEENKLNIWRCHDAWHRRNPDGILTGMAAALGWSRQPIASEPRVYDLPAPMTLRQLIDHAKQSLGVAAVRFVGDAGMRVSRIGISCGCPGWNVPRSLLRQPGVDVVLCGETREWETNEYVRDQVAAAPPGERQGLIVLGHRNSEEAGMQYFAEWLRPMLPGTTVTFVPAGDPFQHA